ncbi:MAG: hypothetical protein KBD37_00055 [Burkholderiales bacterium]|nr:hypothetical protein [Burkholderiales bacterium]
MEKKKKSCILSFRLEEDEYKDYLEKVEKSGYQKSEFFRNIILKNKTKIINKQDSMQVLYHLNKMCNSLNQQTHNLNKSFAENKIPAEVFEGNLKVLNKILYEQQNLIDLLLHTKEG